MSKYSPGRAGALRVGPLKSGRWGREGDSKFFSHLKAADATQIACFGRLRKQKNAYLDRVRHRTSSSSTHHPRSGSPARSQLVKSLFSCLRFFLLLDIFRAWHGSSTVRPAELCTAEEAILWGRACDFANPSRHAPFRGGSGFFEPAARLTLPAVGNAARPLRSETTPLRRRR
jgi:hypothetical protein